MAGRHRQSAHGDTCGGGCGRERVAYPLMQFGQERPVKVIRHRTCGEPDCEVLADLEEDLAESGDSGER